MVKWDYIYMTKHKPSLVRKIKQHNFTWVPRKWKKFEWDIQKNM